MSEPFRSATGLAAAVRAGELSPVDLVDDFLERIDARNDELNAYITVLDEHAREAAREAERAVERGDDLGPLHGVPVAIKDLSFLKEGVPHTMGMKPLSDNVADRTSVAVRRLEDAGAIILGTTNTPELGHKMRTDNELVGPTPTPFDPDYNAGGSSGGSGAALAAGLTPLATGSDVGGSLRNPASCCGVTSVKPTFGLVPRDSRPNAFRGHTPFAVVGPMARTVEDLALLLDVMAGPDDADPYSVPRPDDYAGVEAADPDVLDLAYSPDLDHFAVDPDVRETVRDAVDAVAAEGATVEEVTVGGPDRGDLVYAYGSTSATVFATAVEELNRSLGVDLLEDHGDELSDTFHSVVGMGQGHEVVEYNMTDLHRTGIYEAIEGVIEGFDALVCPTFATPPLTHDEPIPTEIDGESVSGLPMDWGLGWVFNMTGHPVVNLPAGTAGGLPIGLQLVGPRYSERRLLEVAKAFEDANPWSYPDA